MIIQRKINISLSGNTLPTPVRVVEADNVYQLILKYIDFEIPEGAAATMFVKKPSGKFVFQEDNISIAGNVITIDIDNQAIIEDGISPFQVEIKKDGKIVTTFINYFSVEKNLKNPDAEESKTVINAFDILTEQKIKELNERANEILGGLKIEVDSTLTKQGEAADAKAVGDRINEIDGKKIDGAFVKDGHLHLTADGKEVIEPLGPFSEENNFDEALSDVSTNAVQNKVVKRALDLLTYNKIDGAYMQGDYLYLTSGNKIVAGPLGPFSSENEISIDAVLSAVSTNAIQNRAVKNALDNLDGEKIDGAFVENNCLYLTSNDVVVVGPLGPFSGGGGGGSDNAAEMTMNNTSGWLSKTISLGSECKIAFRWSSLEDGISTGNGVMKVIINGELKVTSNVTQGDVEVDPTKHLVSGGNTVRITVSDVYGNTRTINYTINTVALSLSTTFDSTMQYGSNAIFVYVITGSITKTMHFILDGEKIGTETINSSSQKTFNIPFKTHGSNLLEAYATAEVDGETIESNHVFKDIIFFDVSAEEPVIGCDTQNLTVLQHDVANIKYTVVDPKTETSTVTLADNGVVVDILTLDEPTKTWPYKTNVVGNHVLTITCGDIVKTINVSVEAIDIDIEPVTNNLVFDFNPVGKSNSSADRLWTDGTTSMTVSDNFDWANGGYQLDENGDQYFCIKAGTSATIDYRLFNDEAKRTGKEFKLIFKTTNVQTADAKFLSCIDNTTETNHIGIEMFVHEAFIYGGANERLHLPYSEEDIIEFEFNISSVQEAIPMIMGYEDGVSTCPLVYDETYSFTQTNPKYISLGSEKCDLHIYRMKAYGASLSTQDILNNFIADARNASEMIARYNRNQIYTDDGLLTPEHLAEVCPWLRIIKIEAPYFTNNKSDKVKNTKIQHIYKDGDANLDNWTAYNCQHSGQGTSSNDYGASGRNLDLIMNNSGIDGVEPYIKLNDGTEVSKVSLTRNSVDVNYFNVKVNIASSENANNALLQKRYNVYNPYNRAFVRSDASVISKIKDTMEFFNCVVFIKESDTDLTTHREFADNDWHFYAIGNIGDSKKTDDTRLTDPTDKYECIVEIMDVELPLSDFPRGAEAIATLEADKFDEKGTYGWRYLWEDGTDAENAEVEEYCKQKWIDFYKFVVNSTDEEFHEHLGDYFVLDSALYYYLFTTRYTMVDNRAKNTFWHYGKTGEVDASGNPIRKWDLAFDYDNDTSLGINNYGDMVYRYGYEDTDYQDGTTTEVFRESDSTFFCRLRDLFSEELKDLYNTLESDNAWHAESLINQFDEWQSQFPEELWRVDIERKYIRTYNSSFIDGAGDHQFLRNMAHGKKKYQRRQFERNQEKYMASKYQSTLSASDQIVLRCAVPTGNLVVPPNYRLKLTPYSYMYLNVKYGTTEPIQIRAVPGVEYEIPYDGDSADIINIYSSSCLQSVGDLSACYPNTVNTSQASRLKELIIGNSTEGYDNPGLSTLTLGVNPLLEVLDIENVSGLTQSLNLSALNNLRELRAHGSNIGGVVFASGGEIEIAELPAITSLTLKNLMYLDNLDITSLNNLTTLVSENCDTIDAKYIIENSPYMNTVRIVGIDWTLTDDTLLERIYNMRGVGSDGMGTAQSVLTGKVYVPVMRQLKLDQYREAWPSLEIDYGTMVSQYEVAFLDYDGSPILDKKGKPYVQYVDRGSKPYDPIEAGDISTPVRESDAQYIYTFSGWDGIDSTILANETVTAMYSTENVIYNVRWLSMPGVVLQSKAAGYGECVEYTGETPTLHDEEDSFVFKVFTGWNKSTGFIRENTDVYAIWERAELPAVGSKELKDMTVAELYAISEAGDFSEYAELKDYIDINIGHDFDFTNVEAELICENEYFDGTRVLDTGIKLFDTDAPSFTLAIDYEFVSTITNNTLVACFEKDGSEGFRLRYNGAPNIQWGDKTINIGNGCQKNICVLRHRKGSNNLDVYAFNVSKDNYSDAISIFKLNRTRETNFDATLVLGAIKFLGDGEYEDYGTGWINWCKLWYDDLGETNALQLASWTHEVWRAEYTGTGRYQLAGNTRQECAASFILNNALDFGHHMNEEKTNAGGWDSCAMRAFTNSMIRNAFPTKWQSVLKKVKIDTSAGGMSSEIIVSEDYVYLASCFELNNNQTAPYINEGNHIAWFTSNNSRLKFRGYIIPDDAAIYNDSIDPTSLPSNGVKQGDIWIEPNGGCYYYLPEEVYSKHTYYYYESSKNKMASDNGYWIASQYWWLRSPNVNGIEQFWSVYTNGSMGGSINAIYKYSIVPCFSI